MYKLLVLIFLLILVVFGLLVPKDSTIFAIPPSLTPTHTPSSTPTSSAMVTPFPTATNTPTRLPLQDIYMPIYDKPVNHKELCFHIHYFSLARDIVPVDYFVNCYTRAHPFPQDINPFDADFVPAVKDGSQLDDWTANYPPVYDGPVILFNEPGLDTMLTPSEAAAFTDTFRDICPNCYIVAGNMVQGWGVDWWRAYWSLRPNVDAIGIHHYIFEGDTTQLQTELDYYTSFGLPVWVTETGAIDPCIIRPMFDLMQSYDAVDVIVYFGPYTPFNSDIWPPEMRLFDESGNLTANGRALFYDGVNCE